MRDGSLLSWWSRVASWVGALLRGKQQPKVVVNTSGAKPYYQKLTCEHQARSSTGPVARHAGRRR